MNRLVQYRVRYNYHLIVQSTLCFHRQQKILKLDRYRSTQQHHREPLKGIDLVNIAIFYSVFKNLTPTGTSAFQRLDLNKFIYKEILIFMYIIGLKTNTFY